MKTSIYKQAFLLSILFFWVLFCKAQINIWGSAVYLHINGEETFYNTNNFLPPFAIGSSKFPTSLGVFGRNSGNLKLVGAEINTSKTSGYTICTAKLFYAIYKQGERPSQPSLSGFSLPFHCNCDGNSFSNCGGRACNSLTNQKFQNVNQTIDLTGLVPGNYSVEIYYQISGGEENSNCSLLITDDRSGQNYIANFTISSPLSVNFSGFSSFVTDDDIKLKWSMQNDVDIIRYEVEKSENGLNFFALISTASRRQAGNSIYLSNDVNPVFGTNFYRVKAIYDNGVVNLSPIIRAYYGKVGNTLLIYPNPVGKELNIRLAGIGKGNYRLSVLALSGQQLVSIPYFHDGMDKTIKIKLPETVTNGIYRLFLINKTLFYKQTFMAK